MKLPWDQIAGKAYFVFGVIAVLVVPIGLAAYGLSVIGILFAVPLLAWLASYIIVSKGGGIFAWMSRKALEPWEGNYYAFGDVQVRVYDDGEKLWLASADVLKATGLKQMPRSFAAVHPNLVQKIPGTRLTGLTAEGVEKLLGKRNEHEAIRFMQWVRREVVAPWERKRDRRPSPRPSP